MSRALAEQFAYLGLLCSLVYVPCTNATIGRYKRSTNCKLLDNVTVGISSQPSVSACLVACSSLSDCNSVSWHPETLACLMSNDIAEDDSDLEAILMKVVPWVTYGKMHYKVWHAEGHAGKYTLSQENANDRCAEDSGRVASPAEMHTAFLAGFQKCKWAWMSDNTIALVIQAPLAGCSLISYGVIQHHDLTVSNADVFCTDDL